MHEFIVIGILHKFIMSYYEVTIYLIHNIAGAINIILYYYTSLKTRAKHGLKL